MSRSQFPASERALRSRLAKLVHDEPLLRGTLSRRQITCGKANCRCAKGDKHLCVYLTCSRRGRVHQVFIPKALEGQVRQWVHNHRSVRDLLERLCEASWERLQAQKARRR